MSSLFIYPDNELSVQITRLLAILNKLSRNKQELPILTAEKIVVFDFLVKSPYILFLVLKHSGKKIGFNISEEEINSISSQYQTSEGLYRFADHKKILQLLIAWDLIKVSLNDIKEPLYQITIAGQTFLERTATPYSERLQELAHALIPLKNESHKNLIAHILPHLHGK